MRRTTPRLLLTALIAAAATAVAGPTTATATPPADHVLYWNDVLLRAYRDTGGAPGPLARAGAMVHGAIYDAANSALCAKRAVECLGKPYLIKVAPPQSGAVVNVDTAIDYAAYTVLDEVFPNLDFTADRDAALGGVTAQAEAVTMGTAAAQAMLNARLNDNSADTTAYVVNTAPGYWRPAPGANPATPNWGKVKPFTLTSGSQFRPALPGGYSTMSALLASSAYASQVNEVKALGRATGSTRTQEQTDIAWFWANDLDQTYKPPGQLFEHTQIVSGVRQLSSMANAKLFALVAFSMADASITAWDAKYLTDIDLWRPDTAIRDAGLDGNAATTADSAWLPLSADRQNVNFTPPFPAYTSGHATFAASWAGAMKFWFGTDNVTFAATTEDPHSPANVKRTFTTFSAAAIENARSRIYLGVHYQWDADKGISSGTAVAGHVTANAAQVNDGSTAPCRKLSPNGPAVCGYYYTDYLDDTDVQCQQDGQRLVAEHRWTSFKCVEDIESGGFIRLYVK